jgi:hypothetical protein
MKRVYSSLAVIALAFFAVFIIVSCKKDPVTNPPADAGTATATFTVTSTATTQITANITPTPASGNDAYEDDGDNASANMISTDGYPQCHNFYNSDMYDYVSFTAETGSRYMITEMASYPDEMPDLSASLYNSSYTNINSFSNSYTETGLNYARFVLECTTAGTYYISVNRASVSYAGQYTGYLLSVQKLAAIQPVNFETAINNSSLAYIHAGTAHWFGQANISNDAAAAVQSGPIADSQASSFTASVNSGAHVSFYWKVSSENSYDKLSFYVDGVQAAQISGETDWIYRTTDIPSDGSAHTIAFSYLKDNSRSNGYDAGWVDQLSVTY